MMRPLIVAAMVLAAAPALAQDPTGTYSDSATSAWFRDLSIPGKVSSCCNQSDCHVVKAEWRGGPDGDWWAETYDYPGEWLKVPKDHVLNTANPLSNAVLCSVPEGQTNYRNDFAVVTDHGHSDAIYCFVPPPDGF